MGSSSRFPTKDGTPQALARRAAAPSVIRMSDGFPRLSNRTTSSFPLGSTKWKRPPSEKERPVRRSFRGRSVTFLLPSFKVVIVKNRQKDRGCDRDR